MRIYHSIENINGNNQIILYVEYPYEYEFSLDFDSFKQNIKKVSDQIYEYVVKKLDGLSDNTALLILNGVVVGTLILTQLPQVTNTNTTNNTQIASTLEENTNEKTDIDTSNNTSIEKTKEINKLEEDINTEEKKEETNQTKPSNNATTDSKPTSNTNTTNSNKNNSITNKITNTTTTSSNTTSTNTNTTTNNSTSSIPSSKSINVKLGSGQIVNMSLEDYVVGVVGAEMPASFNTEALKAQAIASRTYALKKTATGTTISASISDQVYNTVDQLKQKWGNSFNTYYSKIQNAVRSTQGQCLTYNGEYIEALFFSTSNGRTEDAVNVWGNSFNYLKSVDSPWDTTVSGFSQTKSISMSEISNKLGVNLTSVSDISITKRTVGNRVANVSICGKNYTGVKIRQLLGLRSADFEVTQSGNNIVFTTKGYGHGVGMSQYGANAMANAGYSYLQILKHYYTGVSIDTK